MLQKFIELQFLTAFTFCIRGSWSWLSLEIPSGRGVFRSSPTTMSMTAGKKWHKTEDRGCRTADRGQFDNVPLENSSAIRALDLVYQRWITFSTGFHGLLCRRPWQNQDKWHLYQDLRDHWWVCCQYEIEVERGSFYQIWIHVGFYKEGCFLQDI